MTKKKKKKKKPFMLDEEAGDGAAGEEAKEVEAKEVEPEEDKEVDFDEDEVRKKGNVRSSNCHRKVHTDLENEYCHKIRCLLRFCCSNSTCDFLVTK